MLAMLLYVFDNVYVALCCVYSAACYSTLLYLFLLLDFARGCFILHMLFDVAMCSPHSLYVFSMLLFCLFVWRCFSLAMLLYSSIKCSIWLCFALCCFMLLILFEFA